MYVRRIRKREGIGRALLRRVCEIAAEQGCSRVEWMTEHANADAQRFYAALGAPMNGDKIVYRLEGADIPRVGTS